MKKRIALICGGDSGEYEISIKSAGVVSGHIDTGKFDVYTIVISKQGWFCLLNDQQLPIDKNDFSVSVNGAKIKFDCVFNALHGTPGEDGKLQGYFDLIGMPYTSCGLATSAVTFNKGLCKQVLAESGVLMARSVVLKKEGHPAGDEVLGQLTLPLFIKPNNGGSSVGMSKINTRNEWSGALAKAFKEDDQVIVEEYIQGREITGGVMTIGGEVVALPLTEIRTNNTFFDFQAKYSSGMAEEITPAPIGEEAEKTCKQISSGLYRTLNCKGVVRFDYIMNDRGFYFLEVNTVPGLSEQSIIPQQARAMGLTITELFTRMIEETLLAKGA